MRLALILLTITAGAATAGTITQTVSIPASGTLPVDVNSALGVFNLFGSSGAPAGSTLLSVTLEIVINEYLTALTLTNNSASATTDTRFIEKANFDATDSANTTDSTNLDAQLGNSGYQSDAQAYVVNINAGAIAGNGGTFTCTSSFPCALPSGLSEDTGVVSGATASYLGTGTFNIGFSTSSMTIVTGGGSVNSSPTLVAAAVATVTYTYTAPPTPEPATATLIGSSLLALAVLRRKRSRGPGAYSVFGRR